MKYVHRNIKVIECFYDFHSVAVAADYFFRGYEALPFVKHALLFCFFSLLIDGGIYPELE